MAVYRFRITFEDYDDVSRDIEIRSVQTFEDLHKAIQQFIKFDDSKEASFYMSDDNWKKGREITSRILLSEEKDSVDQMHGSRLCDFIADPHQKIYYISDPVVKWAFHVELIKILVSEDVLATYPRCVKSTGDAPLQYEPVLAGGSVPQPEDFDETTAVLEMEEEEQEESEEVVEAHEVPLSIMRDESEPAGDDFEPADEEIIDSDEEEA